MRRAAVALSLVAALSLGSLAGCARHAPVPAHAASGVAAYEPLDGPDALLVLPEGVDLRLTDPVVQPSFPAFGERGRQSIVFAFVVDTVGTVEPTTVAVLQSSSLAMTRSLCRTIVRQRYSVARVDGRPRRALTLLMWAEGPVPGDSSGPDLGRAARALHAMNPADVVHYLAARPGCA